MDKMIAVIGPTSSGKTALGIFLAKRLKGEILSADSRQVYKGLDIGTGKVTRTEMQGVPHHLLDIVSPKKQFSVDDFVRHAEKAYSSILQNTRIPILVGGTGLYVDTFLGRMTFPNVPPDPKLRARLEKKSAAQLFASLKKKDPSRAKTIEQKNKRRLIRALEIAAALGAAPLPKPQKRYDVLYLGIRVSETELKKRIEKRLEKRLKQGMVREAKKLHMHGLSYKRMRELGLEYRALADYLENRIDNKQLKQTILRDNRQYAKRQMRWFKRNPDIKWVKNNNEALRLAKSFLA